jgi:hypothetical protein
MTQRHGGNGASLPTSAPPPTPSSPPARRSASTGGSYEKLHEGNGKKSTSRWGCAWPLGSLSTTFCGLILGAWTIYWVLTMLDSSRAAAPTAGNVLVYPAGGGEPNSGWFATSAGQARLALTRAGIWGGGAGPGGGAGGGVGAVNSDASSSSEGSWTTRLGLNSVDP